MSEREADRLVKGGVPDLTAPLEMDPETGLPTGHRERRLVPVAMEAPKVAFRPWLNKRTGRTMYVAEGCDPGWDYNVGKTGRLASSLRDALEKLEAAPEALCRAAIRDLVQSPAFETWLANPEDGCPVMRLPEIAVKELGANVKVVRMTPHSVKKNVTNHPDLTVEDYRQLPGMGDNPDLVIAGRERTVILIDRGEKPLMAVVRVSESGRGLYLKSFYRTRDRSVRREIKKGRVLYDRSSEK